MTRRVSYYHIILTIAFLSWIFLFALTPLRTGDVYFNLKSGDEMLAQHTVFSHDIFSYTRPDAPWVNRLWFFQILVSLLFRLCSWPGLVVVKALLATAVFALLLFRYRHASAYPVVVGIAYVVSWCIFPRMVMRPELMTYLFLAITMNISLSYYSRPRQWLTWVMPGIFLVWVNMHGLYIIGLGVYVLMACAYTRRKWDASARVLWISVAASCAALFINPYGIAGVVVPFRQFAMLGSDSFFSWVGELMPLWRTVAVMQSYQSVVAVALCTVLLLISIGRAYRRTRSVHWPLCMIALVLFVLSWMALRNVALFALVSVVVCAEHVGDMALLRRIHRALCSGLLFILLLSATVQVVGGGDYQIFPYPFGVGRSERLRAPERICEVLDRHAIGGPVYSNTLVFSNYYLWRYGPERKVCIDGRLEVYGEEFFREVITSVQEAETFFSLLNRLACRTLIIDHTRTYYSDRQGGLYARIAELEQSPLWTRVFCDSRYVLFVRAEDAMRSAIPLDRGQGLHHFYAPEGTSRRLREYFRIARIADILGFDEMYEHYAQQVASGLNVE